MKFGLKESDFQIILQILEKYPEIKEAILFGSRAMGREKKGSDIDIALKGNNMETIVSRISQEFNEESPLPYYFDILDYHSITNEELKQHIDRVGLIIYRSI